MVRRTKKKNQEPEAEEPRDDAQEAELPEAEVVEEPAEGTAPPPMTLEEQVLALRSECDALREKSLRAQADYQNQKRRALVERDMEVRRRLQPLLAELLLVLDFLDMALASPATVDETKNLLVGVDMTRTRFLQALENAGVNPIATDGAFDPEQHEATETEEAEGATPGSILRVVRRGYEWNDVVLRHAQVVVAAGDTPETETVPTDAEDAADEAGPEA